MAAFHVFTPTASPEARNRAEKLLVDGLLDTSVTETMLAGPSALSLSADALEKIAASKARAPVRAIAATNLANRAFNEAWLDPSSKDKRAKAVKVFEALKKDYAAEYVVRANVGRLADWTLFRLNKLWIGEPAPELKGETADGKAVSLADYRGKVVYLAFHYSTSLGTDMYFSERKYLKDYGGKPFACVSVCLDCTKETLKQHNALNRVSWPNIADGGTLPPDTIRTYFPSPLAPGPNAKAWQIHDASAFVIDKHGIIRHIWGAGDAKAVLDELLK